MVCVNQGFSFLVNEAFVQGMYNRLKLNLFANVFENGIEAFNLGLIEAEQEIIVILFTVFAKIINQKFKLFIEAGLRFRVELDL